MEKMKIELDMKILKEENEMEKMKEDNEMEKFRMKQVKEETDVMMMDVSTLSSVHQEYIRQHQMEILEKQRFSHYTIIFINALVLYD